jgi:hypothetical protein
MGHPGINLVVAHLMVVYLAIVNLTVVCLMIIAFTTIDSAGRASRISVGLRAAANVTTRMAGG